MRPLKAAHAWVWRRLEPRVQASVDQRFAELRTEIRATADTAREALRLATEASRAIERILQTEIEIWRAIDEARNHEEVRNHTECECPGATTRPAGRSA